MEQGSDGSECEWVYLIEGFLICILNALIELDLLESAILLVELLLNNRITASLGSRKAGVKCSWSLLKLGMIEEDSRVWEGEL